MLQYCKYRNDRSDDIANEIFSGTVLLRQKVSRESTNYFLPINVQAPVLATRDDFDLYNQIKETIKAQIRQIPRKFSFYYNGYYNGFAIEIC